MSEIEKMHENAEVKKQIPKICSSNELYCKECEAHIEDAMPYCKNAEYPPFTAEKQLSITKLIGLRYGLKFITNEGMDYILSTDLYNNDNFDKQGYGYGYDEAIANLVNSLWQDLTGEEKQQVKGILE